MNVTIELAGSRRQVTLRRAGNDWQAQIGDRTLAVSFAAAGGRWSMLVRPETAASAFPAAGSSYDVAVETSAAGAVLVHVNGVAVPVTLVDPRRHRRGGRGMRHHADGPDAITAPMTGRIVKVLVKPGERVQARQGLVVVEAMKMENELRAPRAGIVAQVRVSEGASVEANAVLVVLE